MFLFFSGGKNVKIFIFQILFFNSTMTVKCVLVSFFWMSKDLCLKDFFFVYNNNNDSEKKLQDHQKKIFIEKKKSSKRID